MTGDLQHPSVPMTDSPAVVGSNALALVPEQQPRSLTFMRPRSIFDLTDQEIKRLNDLALMLSQLHNFKLITVGFDKAAKLSKEEYIAIMLQGMAIGIDPMIAPMFFNIIDGKLAINVAGMMAKIQASGLLEDLKVDSQETYCEVTMKRRGVDTPHTERFTIEQAKALNFTGKKNWQTQPRNMLKLRALSACGRVMFSDVINGLYTVEELEDFLPDAPLQMPQTTLREVPRPNTPPLSVLPKPAASGEPVNDDDYEPPFGSDKPVESKTLPHWATVKANQDQLVALMKQYNVGASAVLGELHPGQNITKWSESTATFEQIKIKIAEIGSRAKSTDDDPAPANSDWFDNLEADETPRKPAGVKGAGTSKPAQAAPATVQGWKDDDEIRTFLTFVWDAYNRDPKEFLAVLGGKSVRGLNGMEAAKEAFKQIAINQKWEMVATQARYFDRNGKVCIEWNTPVPILQFGRSTTFKAAIGDAWYSENKVEEWVVGNTYDLSSPLQIHWEGIVKKGTEEISYYKATTYEILDDAEGDVE